MPATKILWGQILVVAVFVLGTTWGATQWTAWQLGYQAQLGAPWFVIEGHSVYPPPAFFWWWYWFDAYAPEVFYEGAIIAAAGGFGSIALAIAMSVWRARDAREVTTYGSARWATPREIRAAGLLGPAPLETSVPGVFAIGDVRAGSVKRVGAAIGEGAAVVAQLHAHLAAAK